MQTLCSGLIKGRYTIDISLVHFLILGHAIWFHWNSCCNPGTFQWCPEGFSKPIFSLSLSGWYTNILQDACRSPNIPLILQSLLENRVYVKAKKMWVPQIVHNFSYFHFSRWTGKETKDLSAARVKPSFPQPHLPTQRFHFSCHLKQTQLFQQLKVLTGPSKNA